jgi:hypothetical protein
LGAFTNKSLETIQEKSSVLSNLVRERERERGDEREGLGGEVWVGEGSVIRISGILMESGRDMGDGEVL